MGRSADKIFFKGLVGSTPIGKAILTYGCGPAAEFHNLLQAAAKQNKLLNKEKDLAAIPAQQEDASASASASASATTNAGDEAGDEAADDENASMYSRARKRAIARRKKEVERKRARKNAEEDNKEEEAK